MCRVLPFLAIGAAVHLRSAFAEPISSSAIVPVVAADPTSTTLAAADAYASPSFVSSTSLPNSSVQSRSSPSELVLTSSTPSFSPTSTAFFPEETSSDDLYDIPQPNLPAYNIDIPSSWTVFKTEPDFRPEHFDVVHITLDRSLLAPGYIFLDPTFQGRSSGLGPWGSQIYDQDGNLVYHGEKGSHSQDLHVCDYLGSKGTHLCFHQRLPREDWREKSRDYRLPSGVKIILDENYNPDDRSYITGLLGFGPNGHEFNMIEDGYSFLQPVSMSKRADLRRFGGPRDGWIEEMCFQEIDVRTNGSKFHWCWTNHLPLSQSTLYSPQWGHSADVSSPKAKGGTRKNPWDFAHFNSIDKNFESDYLVSARHCDVILKVAGNENPHGVKPGTVLWQLGGNASDFTMDTTFSRQHSIRYISTSKTETVISILDNASEGVSKPSADYSAGKIIKVNNETMQATLIREYPEPEGYLTPGKGNMQPLDNGNVIIGWGILPALTEYSEDGTILYHARYAANLTGALGTGDFNDLESSYRAFKSPWVGRPYWKPKLVAYSRSCAADRSSPLMAYVSWNGATEVVKWRFRTAMDPNGPWFPAGDFHKRGFETQARLSNPISERFGLFAPWVSVQALDASGTVIGSTTSRTFVPRHPAANDCDESSCNEPPEFDYTNDSLNSCEECTGKQVPLLALLIMLFLIIEAFSYLTRMVLSLMRSRAASKGARRAMYQLLSAAMGDDEDLAAAAFGSEKLCFSARPRGASLGHRRRQSYKDDVSLYDISLAEREASIAAFKRFEVLERERDGSDSSASEGSVAGDLR